MIQTDTLIIGAGPAGLAIAGRLAQAGRPYTIIEESQFVGNAWRNHYERVHLHTMKEFSHLPHVPFPKSAPRYIPRVQMVEYLEAYAQRFGIQPMFGEKAVSGRQEEGKWIVNTSGGQIIETEHLVLATGVNRHPNIPQWPGQDQFQGEILHSRLYKTGAAYRGKNVLVVGMGNTGAEIALDLFEQGANASLSVRGPVNIVMRDTFGNPIQRTSMMIGKLPTWLGDPIGRFLANATVGNLSPYGLNRPDMAPSKQLRTLGKTPVIDVGTIRQIKRGNIRVFRGIQSFGKSEVNFTDGQSLQLDAVVLATGYMPSVTDVLEGVDSCLNDQGNPTALWSDDHPGLYFLGFDPYSNGILKGIHDDSEKILNQIAANA